MSKLEEYIRENKKGFDTKRPSEGLWERIEADLDKKKEKRPLKLPLWIGIAAAVVIVMGVTLIFTYHDKSRRMEVADVNPLLAKKEIRFANLIEEKRDSLEVFAKDNPALYTRFNADLERLTLDYRQMKEQLPGSPNQKLVISAMVKNLELQLQVINQQLLIINQVNEYKRENKI